MKKSRIALFALAAALAGCGTREWDVVIQNDAHPASVEVLVDGRSAGTFTSREIRLKVPERAPKKDGISRRLMPLSQNSDVILVRVPTACGPVTFRVSSSNGGLRFRFSEADLLRRPGEPSGFIDLHEAWFDNRGGAAAELRVGSFRYEVAAGTSGPVGVPSALCPEEQAVLLDGKRIGTMPLASRRLTDSGELMARSAFLIDPTGKRCYHAAIITYGLGAGPFSETLRENRFHQGPAPHFDHFLESAPASISTVAGGGSRTQLVDCSR